MRVLVDTIKLPDGRIVDDYHRVEFCDCSIVYAKTPEGLIVTVRQYNHGPRSVGLSLPAGGLVQGEDPLAGAKRELLEETGYAACEWQRLGQYAANGNHGCGIVHVFSASCARKIADPNSGDLEEMEVLLMPPEILQEALRSGEVKVLAVAAAIGLANMGSHGTRAGD